MTTEELAECLGVAKQTVNRWIREQNWKTEKFPGVKGGRARLIHIDASVREFILNIPAFRKTPEIYQVNEAYEWVTDTVKTQLKKDFQGLEEDLQKIQDVIDSGVLSPKKKEPWLAFGIAICTILANEVEGMEWMTLVDGNREVPVLRYEGSEQLIDPMKLLWSRVKAGEACEVAEAYKQALIH